MLSSNAPPDSLLASYPDILVKVQVYRPSTNKKVLVYVIQLYSTIQ